MIRIHVSILCTENMLQKICVTYLQFKNFCLYIDIHTQHTRTRHSKSTGRIYTRMLTVDTAELHTEYILFL